nr:MAG TPA: hypothetical protein [Caudoviricetes sp.]
MLESPSSMSILFLLSFSAALALAISLFRSIVIELSLASLFAASSSILS